MGIDLSKNNFKELKEHVGHDIQCVIYGDDENIAIECHTCHVVLVDYDNPDICPYCGGECPVQGDKGYGCDEWNANE